MPATGDRNRWVHRRGGETIAIKAHEVVGVDARVPWRPEHEPCDFVEEVAVERIRPIENPGYLTFPDESVAVQQISMHHRSLDRRLKVGLQNLESLPERCVADH